MRERGVVPGLVAAFLLAACSASPPPRLVVDPSLGQGDAYAVSGLRNHRWGKPLQFGGFATRETRVGESWSWSAGLFDLGVGARGEPYRFVFVGEGGDEWQVECRSRTPILQRNHGDGGYTRFDLGPTRLGCGLRDAAGAVHSLTLAGTGLEFDGRAEVAGQTLAIRGLHELTNARGEARRIPAVLGYELRDGDRVVGSVDVLDGGRVYLAGGLTPEERDRVAMAAAVLLFFGQA
jgi:hypothetical protein